MSKPEHSVYVGNIPYGTPEESIKALLATIGPVVRFKSMVDSENGTSKGYGFCEYPDRETAESCIRNLNNVEFQGRNLKVDFMDKSSDKDSKRGRKTSNANAKIPEKKVEEQPSPKTEVSNICDRLLSIVLQMKTMIETSPEMAHKFFMDNEAMGEMMLATLIRLRLVDPGMCSTLTSDYVSNEKKPTDPRKSD